MLTVSSIVPVNTQTAVYRDTSIVITFSHELHQASLTSANFRLYVMPGYAGNIPLAINKSSNVVTLTPNQDLAENQQYQVWVKGDSNTGDATTEGVVSVLGESMDGNYSIVFTTGNQRQIDVIVTSEIGGYDPTEGTVDPISTPDEQAQAYAGNAVIDIIRTFPQENATLQSDLSSITFTCDQEVYLTKDLGDSDWPSGVVSIDGDPIVFGETPNIPSISNVSVVNGSVITVTTDNDISNNTIYTVTLYRDAVASNTAETMVDDYTLSFMGPIHPLYTNVRTVRRRGGYLVPSSIRDITIYPYILEAGLWAAIDILGLNSAPSGTVPRTVVDLVTCKTVYDIAQAISFFPQQGIKEKRLADLQIVYDATQARSGHFGKIEDCIDNALEVFGHSKVGTGIKSGGVVKYPGGKRRVHDYSLYRIETDIYNSE